VKNFILGQNFSQNFCPMCGKTNFIWVARTKIFRKFLSLDKFFSENFYPRTKNIIP